jgi:hypothetical protein
VIWLGTVLQALAEAFGFARERTKLKNAKDVKLAKIANEEQECREEMQEAIEDKDTDTTRDKLR